MSACWHVCLNISAGAKLHTCWEQDGSAARATACTALNEHSSRSHAILSVRLQPAGSGHTASVLHLVDLAGARVYDGCQTQCQPCAHQVRLHDPGREPFWLATQVQSG